MLNEGISILEYFNRTVCDKCAFYKTSKCNPQIGYEPTTTPDYTNYSIKCFEVEVKSISAQLDEALTKEDDNGKL